MRSKDRRTLYEHRSGHGQVNWDIPVRASDWNSAGAASGVAGQQELQVRPEKPELELRVQLAASSRACLCLDTISTL